MLKKLLNRKNNHELHPLLRKRLRPGEFMAEYTIRSVAFISFAVIILIFVFVFRETLPIFSKQENSGMKQEELVQETYGEDPGDLAVPEEVGGGREVVSSGTGHEGDASLSNLMGDNWQPVSDSPKYGLLPLFWGSFKVTIISILIAAPIGILAALFTAVLAPVWLKEILKPTIELLAGIPSVVVGFFALVVIASVFQDFFGYQYRLNAFIGGVALSLAVIPIIYTVTDDALTTVPRLYTEAALALGATRWQTALFVVLPAATPGIFAAILLGIGRAFGETMIVLMATGNAALMSFSMFDPVRTMSATIGAEMAEVVFGDTHYSVLFLIGSILFVFTFLLNAVAEFYVRKRLMVRFRGE